MNSANSPCIVRRERDRNLLKAELDLALSAIREFDQLHCDRDDARRNALLRRLAAAVSAYLSTCEDVPLEIPLGSGEG